MDNDNAAFVSACVARALITAMGMQAENQQRIHRGESLAYVEADFSKVIEQESIGWNDVITHLRG